MWKSSSLGPKSTYKGDPDGHDLRPLQSCRRPHWKGSCSLSLYVPMAERRLRGTHLHGHQHGREPSTVQPRRLGSSCDLPRVHPGERGGDDVSRMQLEASAEQSLSTMRVVSRGTSSSVPCPDDRAVRRRGRSNMKTWKFPGEVSRHEKTKIRKKISEGIGEAKKSRVVEEDAFVLVVLGREG